MHHPAAPSAWATASIDLDHRHRVGLRAAVDGRHAQAHQVGVGERLDGRHRQPPEPFAVVGVGLDQLRRSVPRRRAIPRPSLDSRSPPDRPLRQGDCSTSQRWWTGSWIRYRANESTVNDAPSLRRPCAATRRPTPRRTVGEILAGRGEVDGDHRRVLLVVALGHAVSSWSQLANSGSSSSIISASRVRNSRNTSRTCAAYSSVDHDRERAGDGDRSAGAASTATHAAAFVPHHAGHRCGSDRAGIEAALGARPLEHPRPVLVVGNDRVGHRRSLTAAATA